MSDRELAIEGFTKAMTEQWNAGNVSMARFIERQITSLENMTDEAFLKRYEEAHPIGSTHA